MPSLLPARLALALSSTIALGACNEAIPVLSRPGGDAGAATSSGGFTLDPPGTRGLVARWDFDQKEGLVAVDVTGRGHDGDLRNMDPATAWSDDHAPTPFANAGSIALDGINDWILVGLVDFARADYTVALWFKSQSPNNMTFFSAGSDNGEDHGVVLEQVGLDGNPQIYASYLHRIPFGNAGGTVLQVFEELSDGTWHHLAGVKRGADMAFYIDGVLRDTATDPTSYQVPLLVVMGRLAEGNGSRRVEGNLDDVRVYEGALTEATIRYLAGSE